PASGPGRGTDGGRGRWRGVDNGTERVLPGLRPLTAVLDLLEPAVDERLEIVVTVLEPDAVRLLGEGVADDLDLRVRLGVASKDGRLLTVGIPPPLHQRGNGLRVGAKGDDLRGRLLLGHRGDGRGVSTDDHSLLGKITNALDVRVAGFDGHGEPGLEVRPGE